jgi:hypothetical protein
MDAIAFHKLEAALTATKVPRLLWPRYFEKEEYRQLRRRIRDEDEFRRILRKRLEDDAAERKRRRDFAQFLTLLLYLLMMDEKKPQQWFRQGHRALLRTAWGRNDPEVVECCLCGVALAKFGDEAGDIEPALQRGITNHDGDATIPMRHALRELERHRDEEQKAAAQPPALAAAPDPQPDQQQATPAQEPEELTPAQQNLAAPTW